MANIDEAAVSIQAEIEKLELQLGELLSDSPVMDDEVNAVERDLEALRRRLLETQ